MMTGNLTAEGRALLAKGVTLNFTKMQIGDKNSNMSFDIPIRIEKIENGKAYITGVLDLSSVKQGFFWRECGLYAMDPDAGEILYNYAYSTKPDYIAASDSGMMEEILVSMIATVGSNTNVDVTIDTSMVFATIKQVEKLTITCKSLGMIPDNENESSNNYTKLTDAILNGNTIYVDDLYYIGTQTTRKIQGIHLVGSSENAGFKVINSDTLWAIDGTNITTLKIDGINITSIGEQKILFEHQATGFMNVEEFIMKNCRVIGKLQICKFYFPISNPISNQFGIKTVKIKDNVFENCMSNNHIFLLQNCPHNEILIEGNVVHNWNKVWFYCGISNDHTVDGFVANCKNFICKNNQAYCDDDVWSIATLDKYYGFVLYEGVNAEYKNNRVEGMKIDFATDGRNKVGQYDAYLSAGTVFYENNINKNNISLYADLIEQCPNFFKAKNNPIGKGYRYVRNNIFIVDEAWASERAQEKGTDISSIAYKLYENESPFEEFIYQNNTVRCFALKLTQQNYQAYPVSKFLFTGNDIECGVIDGHIHQTVVDNTIQSIIIENNRIAEIKNTNKQYKKYGFLALGKKNQNTVVKIPYVSIKNNKLIGYYIESPVRGQDVYSPETLIIDKLEYTENEIVSLLNDKASDRLGIYLFDCAKDVTGFEINKLVAKNNKLSYKNGVTVPLKGFKTPTVNSNLSYELVAKPNSQITLLAFNGDILTNPIHINLKVTITNKNTVEDTLFAKFMCYQSKSDGRNKLFFKNNSDESKYVFLIKHSDKNGSFTDNNDTQIKTTTPTGITSPHMLKFYNAVSHGELFAQVDLIISGVTSESTDTHNVKVEIISVEE